MIDGDVLVANHGRWFGIEISIADLELTLRGRWLHPEHRPRFPRREAASLTRKRLLRRRSGG